VCSVAEARAEVEEENARVLLARTETPQLLALAETRPWSPTRKTVDETTNPPLASVKMAPTPSSNSPTPEGPGTRTAPVVPKTTATAIRRPPALLKKLLTDAFSVVEEEAAVTEVTSATA